jgi:hypothetical protein
VLLALALLAFDSPILLAVAGLLLAAPLCAWLAWDGGWWW